MTVRNPVRHLSTIIAIANLYNIVPGLFIAIIALGSISQLISLAMASIPLIGSALYYISTWVSIFAIIGYFFSLYLVVYIRGRIRRKDPLHIARLLIVGGVLSIWAIFGALVFFVCAIKIYLAKPPVSPRELLFAEPKPLQPGQLCSLCKRPATHQYGNQWLCYHHFALLSSPSSKTES